VEGGGCSIRGLRSIKKKKKVFSSGAQNNNTRKHTGHTHYDAGADSATGSMLEWVLSGTGKKKQEDEAPLLESCEGRRDQTQARQKPGEKKDTGVSLYGGSERGGCSLRGLIPSGWQKGEFGRWAVRLKKPRIEQSLGKIPQRAGLLAI